MSDVMSLGRGRSAELHSLLFVSFVYPDELYDHCVVGHLSGPNTEHMTYIPSTMNINFLSSSGLYFQEFSSSFFLLF